VGRCVASGAYPKHHHFTQKLGDLRQRLLLAQRARKHPWAPVRAQRLQHLRVGLVHCLYVAPVTVNIRGCKEKEARGARGDAAERWN
jgi:hypothetical protein